MQREIVQSLPNFGQEELDACTKYMMRGPYITKNIETIKFEKDLAEYIGVKHCIMTTSGTTALIVSMLALKIGQGDEVIVPNYTAIATINAVTSIGATPIIVDVDEDTFTLTLDCVAQFITSKTKAIIHVSLNNRCKKIEELAYFCEQCSIHLIEDSAQSLGCRYRSKHLGTFGIVGCFSLSTAKIISTMQGGFVITNNDYVAETVRIIKNFGKNNKGKYEMVGYNFNYTDLQAVIGMEQLKKLPLRVKRMKEIYELYYSLLKGSVEIKGPPYKGWIPWTIDITLDNRDKLVIFLKLYKVQTRLSFPSIVHTEIYKRDTPVPISEKICNRGIFLPSHTNLTNGEIKYICSLILRHVKTI